MKYPFFSYHYRKDHMLWFRIKGYGLIIKNLKSTSALFSDRNRLNKHIIIGKYIIRPLLPL